MFVKIKIYVVIVLVLLDSMENVINNWKKSKRIIYFLEM